MVNYLGKLIEFHRRYGHYEFFGYAVPANVVTLRLQLIDEEVNKELLPILEQFRDVDTVNNEQWWEMMTELADALGDSLYVIFGTAVSMGIPMDAIFTEIHRSNMTKSMHKDAKSIPGKTLKGPDFEPPKLREILQNPHTWTEPTLNLNRAEARHLMNILIDYTRNPDHSLETVDVIDQKSTNTAALMTRIGLFAVGENPDEPASSKS